MDGEEIDEDLYALASLPLLRLCIFSGCIVDGVQYHTVDRESSRRTQNSGVMVEGSHNEEDIDFYGQLKEVIQLQYNSDANSQRTVVLFKCDWFDTCSKKSRMKNDGYFKSISHGNCWYKDDAFILATQATKVFYFDDNKHGEPWKVVQKFSHRHLWNVNEEINDDTQLPENRFCQPCILIFSFSTDPNCLKIDFVNHVHSRLAELIEVKHLTKLAICAPVSVLLCVHI